MLRSAGKAALQDFLIEASRLFASSLDHETLLATLARLAVPRFADYCAVHLLGDDGTLWPAEVAHAEAEKVELAWSIACRWPSRKDPPSALYEAVNNHRVIFMPEVSVEDIASAARDEEHVQALLQLQIHSAMILPLVAGERAFGTLTFIAAESRRRYDQEDLTFAEAFAGHASLALENARLFAEVTQAREAALRAGASVRLLAEASNEMASRHEPEEALQALAEVVAGPLADYSITYVCEGGLIRRVGMIHADPLQLTLVASLEVGGPPTLADESGAGQVIRTGKPVFVPDIPDSMLESAANNAEYLAVLRRLRPQSSIIVPLHTRGRTVGAIALTFTAHSGRRHSEADFQLAQELAGRAALLVDNARLYREARQAVRARDELLAIVSHDLRNPLSTIVTASAVLELNPPPEQGRKSMDAMRRATSQMNRLVRDLLDISRIEAGGLAVRPQPLDILQALEDARGMFQSRADEGKVELRVEGKTGLPRVLADRERLQQVLANLLDNAFKHLAPGGAITMAAELSGAHMLVSVADTGVGIPKEQQARVFDRFWQSEHERKAGAGLGLAIAKGIVEAHGGVIDLDSTPGEGTVFRFSLSLEKGQGSAAGRKETEAAAPIPPPSGI